MKTTKIINRKGRKSKGRKVAPSRVAIPGLTAGAVPLDVEDDDDFGPDVPIQETAGRYVGTPPNAPTSPVVLSSERRLAILAMIAEDPKAKPGDRLRAILAYDELERRGAGSPTPRSLFKVSSEPSLAAEVPASQQLTTIDADADDLT